MPEPLRTELLGNFPNPFNPSTTIRYQVSNDAFVSIGIYNIRGQRVRTLVNEYLRAGVQQAVWDGTDDLGGSVGSGVYLYRLIAGENAFIGRMVLMK